jgi:hypothetical protein
MASTPHSASASSHPWQFFRAGGVDQVALRSGADILNLAGLDQKLWVALACPTRGLEFDPRTLDLIDADKDGRIRVPEVLQTIEWMSQVLKDMNDLLDGRDALPLSAITDKTEIGAAVLAGAKRILHNLGHASATSICLADVANTVKIFAGTKLNGDGIVPAESAVDEGTAKAIEDIIATMGALTDRSGKPGVDQANVDAFFAQASALSTWQAQCESDPTVLILGDATPAACAALKAVKPKIDDYFARCRLAAFDARATGALNRSEAEFVSLAAKELTTQAEEIARLPLARVEAGKALPLEAGVNPAWAPAIAALRAGAIDPVLGKGRTTLTEADWELLQSKLAPYQTWASSKPATPVEKLGLARLRMLLTNGVKDRIGGLIKQDAALQAENAQVATVEKAIRLFRDLYRFLNNFANFADFYARKGAIFQAGTLYLDGRSCGLCLPVHDAGKHAALAGLSAAYLAYCDCTRPNGDKMSIVAAFTDGDSDHLIVGRNGVFYDRKGRDWDATITKLVANPISIREAFWAPYKKFVRMIEELIAKRAAAADAQSQGALAKTATSVTTADAKPGEKPLEVKKIDVGTVAAIGVAIGGIGAMITGVLGAFFGLGAWMPIGIAALVLMISGPSMLLAYLKLRQRNLGPILDANGWAINGRARINVPFGGALTDVAKVPPGSQRTLDDPYADKRQPWRLYVTLLVTIGALALWYIGKMDGYLPGSMKSISVLGTNAPAYKPAAAAVPPTAPAAVTAEKK